MLAADVEVALHILDQEPLVEVGEGLLGSGPGLTVLVVGGAGEGLQVASDEDLVQQHCLVRTADRRGSPGY